MDQEISANNPAENVITSRSAAIDQKTIWKITLLVLFLRVCIFAWAAYVHPSNQAAHETLTQIWSRWDGRHYLEIAKEGYDGKSLPADSREFNSRFTPLYPILVRYANVILPIPDYDVGIIVSVLCFIAASLMIFSLAQFEFQNRRAAWWAVIFLSLHPGSYFAHAVYAESLFIFLLLLYLYDLRVRKSYFYGALSLAALLLTRQAGLAFLPLHAFEGLKRLWRGYREKQFSLRLFLNVALCGLIPLVAYGSFRLLLIHLELPGYAGKDVPFGVKFPFSETYGALKRFANWHDAWADTKFIRTLGISHLALTATAFVVFAGCFVLPYEYSIAGVGYIFLFSIMNWNIASVRYMFCLGTTPLILVALFPEWMRWIVAAVSAALLLYFTFLFIAYYSLI